MVQLYTPGTPRTIHQFWQRCYFEDLWAYMGEQAPRARYLEVGAGRGTTSMYLASRNCDVTMLDLSSEGFRVAKQNFAREGLRVPKMMVGDASSAGLREGSFDCILSIGLLEHFTDPRMVLEETLRLLAPGGLHFGIVIPERRASVRWLTNTMFAPWKTARGIAGTVVRGLRRQNGGGKTQPVYRNDLQSSYYVKTLQELDATEIQCIPYNPYHPVYDPGFLESAVLLPAYRVHAGIGKLLHKQPLLKTHEGIASCDLLTFRKRK
jgi:SAM-dependent methyltransferase